MSSMHYPVTQQNSYHTMYYYMGYPAYNGIVV